MGTKNENIAPMPVISPQDLESETAMTAEQFEREKKYQAALCVARSMQGKGIINEEDFLYIEDKLREKFKPFFGGFLV